MQSKLIPFLDIGCDRVIRHATAPTRPRRAAYFRDVRKRHTLSFRNFMTFVCDRWAHGNPVMKITIVLHYTSLALATIIDTFNHFDIDEDTPQRANVEVVNAPDGQFWIEVEFYSPRILLFSYLMNTVEILTELCLEDFLGGMGTKIWKLLDYPDVGIMVSPQVARALIQRRFVIWGLSYGAAILSGIKRWQAADLHLRWNGVKVGTIMIIKLVSSGCPSTLPYLNVTTNLIQQPDRLIVNGSRIPTNCSSTFDLGIDSVEDIRGKLTGRTLDLFNSFLLIMTVIVESAPLEATERVDGYRSATDFPNMSISFSAKRRTTTPYFEAQWLIHAVGAIPDLVIRRGGFREGQFQFNVDQVLVAEGSLQRKSSLMGTTPASWNVSVI